MQLSCIHLTNTAQRRGTTTRAETSETCRFGGDQTARWSRGMGRWGFGCIHHASVENQPSADDVGWVGRVGGGRRVGLARSRRHGGVVGWVDGASAASITRAWRISRRLTTWVGPDGWEEGDVSVGLRRPRGYLHCAGRGAPTVHYGTPNRGGLDGHHHGAVVGTVDDFHRVLETTATPPACRVSSLVLDSAARVGVEATKTAFADGSGGC